MNMALEQSTSSTMALSVPPPHANDASSKPRPKLLAALRKSLNESSGTDTESEGNGSATEDEAPISKAPLNPLNIQRPQLSSKESDASDESDGDAYERMKKRLKPNKSTIPPQEAQKYAPIVATIESSEDEDEIPVRANARKSTTKRTETASLTTSPSPSARSRRSSPGLFVTPDASPVSKRPSRVTARPGSESDHSILIQDTDLQERVRRIRAERLAKQKEEEAQQTKSKKGAQRRTVQGSGSDTDGETGRRLTQQAKPTRRAGKKAMELMARDQQRISRNMQLSHQAKTKKRFTKQDLFKRFGFQAPAEGVALPTPESSSVLASSDAEANNLHNTPPTSPPVQEDVPDRQPARTNLMESMNQDAEHEPTATKVDKGKGRAPEFQHLPLHPWRKQTGPVKVRNATVDVGKASDDAMVELSDSDDDAPLTQPKSRFPVFDRMPTKQQHDSGSMVRLRALAQLIKSPPKGKKGQKTVSLSEMQYGLALKARQQTMKAKQERIADLVARGHHVETEEEAEKRQTEIEDLVAQFEKQRQEDLELAKMERKEAKKNGETLDELPSSDEEDGDYVGSGEEEANQEEADDEAEVEVELSGSEDEEMEDGGKEEHSLENLDGVIDDVADENDEQEDTIVDDNADVEDDDMSAPVRRQTVNRARKRVIDDEDEESEIDAPKNASATPQATQDAAMAAFGFGNPNVGVGLTQMFAGTMADMESTSQPGAGADLEPEQNSLDFLRSLPDTQPGANFSQASELMVPNSQAFMSPRKASQTGPDSQFSLGISQLIKTSPAFSRTQLEDFEPTQDAGFSFSRSPASLAPPPSTMDTVMLPIAESPIKQKKGKLQRGRREAAIELSDVEDDVAEDGEELSEDDIQRPPRPNNAFLQMQKSAQRAKVAEEAKKKMNMAKEAVMEQAEESEDEYAGLGGASDDEEGEEDQDLRDMIDHNDVKVDERQIAAFYADKSKKEDEKNIAELYKKIQTGGLRRQAGGHGGFDMSDSEDEAEMRQRQKRAAFKKQTNELLKDQKVKALADDRKKNAFFNTLADFADEGEYDFLEMPADLAEEDNGSQSQEQQETMREEDVTVPDSQVDSQSMPAPMNPLKRKSPDSQKENRPPPKMRRTAAADSLSRKPMTLQDVEHSISELLDDPRIIVPDSQFSDAEDYEEDQVQPTGRKPVVDRLTLSRTSSMAENAAMDTNLAFHAPSRAAAAPGFRVPSLIRQATSNLSVSSERSTGASTPKENAVRRGGTGRSNIHAQAREAERRALLEKKEGKRKEALRKKVEGGRKRGSMRSVLGDLGGGFE